MDSLFKPIPESPDNKAIRELRDELKDLNKNLKESIRTNDRFTRILLLVAILQLGVGLFQFVSSLLGPITPWIALGVEVVLGIVLLLTFKSVTKSLGLRSDK